MPKISQVLVGLVCILVVLACATYALVFLIEKTGSQVAVAILGVAGALVGAAYQFRLAKEKEAEARLFSEKQKVYSELITTISLLYQNFAPADENDVARRLFDIRTSLIIWGSFETLRCLDALSLPDVEHEHNPLKWGIKKQAELFAAIRKDLGHKDPSNAGLEIAIGIIKGDERDGVRSQILS